MPIITQSNPAKAKSLCPVCKSPVKSESFRVDAPFSMDDVIGEEKAPLSEGKTYYCSNMSCRIQFHGRPKPQN